VAHWIVAAIAAAAILAALSARLGAIESHLLEHIDRQIHHLRKVTTMSAQDTVNALAAQIRRGTQEVLGKISELQTAVDAGQPVDLSELAAAAQVLDDIVADPIVVEEDEVEEVVEEDVEDDVVVEDPVVDPVVDEPVAD
jgi:hypothetical protein